MIVYKKIPLLTYLLRKIFKSKNLLSIPEPELGWYIEHTFFEEAIFRYIGIFGILWVMYKFNFYGLLPIWIAIITIDIIWSLLHLIGFRWQMVACTLPLGILLGWMLFWWDQPFGYTFAVIVHTIVGIAGYKMNIIQKWMR